MKKALIIIAFLAAVALGLVLYSGICYSVSVTEKEIGPYAMVLKKHIGSYYKTGSVFEEVGEVLGKKIDIKTLKGAGLYYDDPAKVKEEELRSECGFIVSSADLGKIGALDEGLFVRDFQKKVCATCEFPIKTYLSYMIGPSKVYPVLGEYLKGKTTDGDFGLEIYDMQEKKIIYCMPIKAEK